MAKLGNITVGVVWKPTATAIGVYIGRNTKKVSPLGNPFIINTQCSREQAIARYKPYIRAKVKTDPEVKQELIRIAKLVIQGFDVELLCYCKGKEIKDCHGDFIKEFVESAIERKLTKS